MQAFDETATGLWRWRIATGQRSRQDALLVFAVALVLRLVAVLEIQRSVFSRVLVGDGRQYDAWARSLAGGGWLGQGVFYQAPLYPYFLGLVYAIGGPQVVVARVVQALIGALSCVLVMLAGRRILDRRAGLLAGLFLALYAPAVFFDLLVQKTVLDAGLMTLLVYLVARAADRPRGRAFFAAGLALAGLCLSRENALALLPLLVAWIAIAFRGAGRRWQSWVLLFLAGVAVPLFPVALRNRVVGREFALTTAQLGPNFYIGNNAQTDGRYVPLRPDRSDARYERADAEALAEEASGRKLTPAGVSSFWFGRALEYIRTQPGDWLRLEARKTRLFWSAGEVVDTEGIEAYREHSRALRYLGWFFHFGTLAPLAVLGLAATAQRWRRLWIWYGFVAVISASVIAFFVLARYRQPVVPVLALFAAAGIGKMVDRARARQRLDRRAWGAVVLTLLVAVLVNLPFPFTATQRAISYYSVGDALVEEGRPAEAIPCLEEALRAKADFTAARLRLSTALETLGRVPEAIALLERGLPVAPAPSASILAEEGRLRFLSGDHAGALAAYQRSAGLDPGRASAQGSLGGVLLALGRDAEAVGPLEKAVALDPQLGPAQLNLGLVYFRLGRAEEASAHLDRAALLEPGNAGVFIVRGSLREAMGRREEALADYRQARRIDPGNEEARRRLDALR